SLLKLAGYFAHPVLPNWHAVAVALIVIVTMIAMPRLTTRIPGSLVGIVLATIVAGAAGWNIAAIGAIPNTIVLAQRLSLGAIPWAELTNLFPPAIAIAALGAIETLLCGAVAGNMTGKPMDNNQELIGQGIGNMLIP